MEQEKEEQLRTILAKKQMLEALTKTLGIVSPALRKTKIGRTAYYRWLKEDPEFRAATEAIPEIALDVAEAALMKGIRNGSEALIKFYLSTKGKDRGFITRTEVSGPNGDPIQVTRRISFKTNNPDDTE